MKWFKRKKERGYELGEGMILQEEQYKKVLINTQKGKSITLINEKSEVVGITLGDIDFARVNKLVNHHNAERLYAPYGFNIGKFSNGIALLSWTLYPDGRYFEDEDGFGGEDCNETVVYGFMDCEGKMVIPFQDMEESERESLRNQAEEKVKEDRESIEQGGI